MGKYFGTDGVRGIANDKLTPQLAYAIGRFIGNYKNPKGNKIVISRDTRISGPLLTHSLISGVLASGGNVYDIGVSSTPNISHAILNNKYDFGVMISASHNPYYDNGIKVFDKEGKKLDAAIEELIEEFFEKEDATIALAKNTKIGRYFNGDNLRHDYINFLLSMTNVTKGNFRVLVDLANGSATNVAKEVFEKIDLEVEFIFDEPNGVNINEKCGSTNLKALKNKINEHEPNYYQIAISFDGDADRVLFMDGNGLEYDGDHILYLLANNLKEQGKLHDNTVVITVMANLGLRLALQDSDINYEIVDVGDKYIQKKIHDKGYSLGGEQSGHIIIGDILNTGDGILTALQVLSIISTTGKSISQLTSGFRKFPQKLINVRVENKDAVLENEGLQKLIAKFEKEFNGSDNGRILVRKSGTEPLIRVMVEASEEKICNSVCQKIADYIAELTF